MEKNYRVVVIALDLWKSLSLVIFNPLGSWETLSLFIVIGLGTLPKHQRVTPLFEVTMPISASIAFTSIYIHSCFSSYIH
jgi:hypothetical protein